MSETNNKLISFKLRLLIIGVILTPLQTRVNRVSLVQTQVNRVSTPNSCTDAINQPARCGGSPRCSDWRRVS
ncbi:MAG: hypothetical protein V7K46_07840 [Nostoc sp.]